MTTRVHSTAILDPSVQLGNEVVVGPYVVLGPNVEVGDRTLIEGHAQVNGFTRIGSDNHIFPYSSLGTEPQDLKFAGEECWLEIGAHNSIREFCTFNRGTAGGGGVTRVGSHGLFMAYSHVGHDSTVGDHVVFANNGTLAGHVEVQEWAGVGAFSSVHQFCRVGRHAYIGGYSVITKDVLPFGITVGEKPRCTGLNRIGLERRGFTEPQVRSLERAFRKLLRSKLNTQQALKAIENEIAPSPPSEGEPQPEQDSAAIPAGRQLDEQVRFLVDFVRSSRRGVIKMPKRGSRGAA